MWGTQRVRRLFLVGAVALAGLAHAAPAGAQEDGSAYVPFGYLRLSVANGAATVTFTSLSGEVKQTQAITQNKCAADAGPPGSALLLFDTDGGGLGLNVSALGVQQKGNCATDSGRISGAEVLTLSLNTANTGAYGRLSADNIWIRRAELDIESGKKGSQLGVTLDDHELAPIDLLWKNASGVNDNTRVKINEGDDQQLFRSITLSAVGSKSEVSLKGGGDGGYEAYAATPGMLGDLGVQLGTADTILELVKEYDSALECGGSVSNTANSTTAVLSLESTEGCEPVGATLDTSGAALGAGVVLLDKSPVSINGTVQEASAELKIIWEPTMNLGDLHRKISYDPDAANPEFVDVEWCRYKHGQRTPPPGHTWCLYWQVILPKFDHWQFVGWQQTQWYYGDGDPMWR